MTLVLVRPGPCRWTLEAIYRAGEPAIIDPQAHIAVERAAERIARIAAGDAPVYGVNTGFGKLASVRIGDGDLAALQRNLILSHAAASVRRCPRASCG